jgi:hypothetical protein
MRSVQHLSAPDRTVRIFRESAIVAKAISRHRREATLQGRTEEACGMETLHSGISGMVLALTRPYQQTNNVA